MKTLLAVSLVLASTMALSQDDKDTKPKKNERGFYSEGARGWLFYEDPKLKPKEEKKKPPPPPAPVAPVSKSKQEVSENEVKLSVEWLRDNLPQMLDDAQNNPTDENIARYMFAQRLSLDMSSRFQTATMDFMERNPILDENNRRPTTGIDLVAFKGETAVKRKAVMDKLKQKAHLWFFYKSTCEFCHKQIPILNAVFSRYEIETLAVTMDGARISNMDKFLHRVDTNLEWTRRMNVTRTPTIMLMMNDGSGFTTLTNGLETLPSIEEKLMKKALEMGVITEREFEDAQSVIDINSLKKVDGALVADKERLENDPNYFAEIIRRQIELNNRQFGSSAVEESNGVNNEK